MLYSIKYIMKKFLILNKKEGETPLEALNAFRCKYKKYKDIKMTYAGRLDPMASGVLLVLIDDEVKNKEKYLKMDKEYEFEILFGFATDTYDILGKVTSSKVLTNFRIKDLKKNLKYFRGKFRQKYPLYSSKNIKQILVGKKPKATSHWVEVKKLNFLGLKIIGSRKLLQEIEKRIQKVKGDFRQKEILEIWRANLKGEHSIFKIASFKIKCGSGMYVRQLAHDLGERLGVPALAYKIKRTKVGKFDKIT